MAFINDRIQEINVPAELQIFECEANQAAIQKIYTESIRPVTNFGNSDSDILFNIPNSGQDYVDLRHSRLRIKCKILKADNSAIASKTDHVGPINNIVNSLWNQVEIFFNGTLVSDTSPHYTFKSYLKRLLTRGKGDDRAEGFFMDDLEYNDGNSASGTNSGLIVRSELFKNSTETEFEAPLMEGVMTIDKFLLNKIDIQIKLHMNASKFLLISDEENASYKLQLTDIAFRVCKVKVDQGLQLTNEQTLMARPAVYCYDVTNVNTLSIPLGSSSFSWNNIFQNSIPEHLMVVMMSQSAYLGSYAKNPFKFQPFNLSDVNLYINGELWNGESIKMSSAVFLNHLKECSKRWSTRLNNSDLSLFDFNSGSTILTFPIKPINRLKQKMLGLINSGVLSLEITFKKTTTENITCLALGDFQCMLEINQDRRVKVYQYV